MPWPTRSALREAEILRLHDAGTGSVKLGARFRLAYAKINAIVAWELARRCPLSGSAP